MQKGYVVLQTTVLLLIGVAGAGKTTFCHLLFNEPPPKVRKSTPIARSSIRAVSLTKACVETEQEEIIWERVTAKMLNSLIGDGIKTLQIHGSHLQSIILTDVDELKMQQKTSALVKQSSRYSMKDISKAPSSDDTRDIQEPEKNETIAQTTVARGNSNPMKSDVNQLFEMEHIKELLEVTASAEGSGEIFKRKWLYVIDTGGQPQFHELLPTFVRHASAAAFFVKLNEKLSSYPMIEYYDEEGERCGKPYKSSSNHLQTLQNCLQAMQSRHRLSTTAQCPKLFFVGTHYDKESMTERLKSKNDQLLSMLCQHDIFCDNLVYHSLGKQDQLLYPVNAKKPGRKDKKIIADFREKIMSQCEAQEYKIPIVWFVLEQLLQDLSKDGVISFDECLEVARHLGMDEEQLLAALEYLAKLNIFEYYSTVLPKVVFTTSQVLLNKITELVEYSHVLRDHSSKKINIDISDVKFRDYGIINADMLKREKFSSHYITDLFEAENLLELWVELLVVAKGKDGTFVVPAVLSELSLKQLSEHRLTIDSSDMIPIAIHYPGGLFPSGIFSSLISYLQNKTLDCTISMKDGKPACLFKNCVKFSVSKTVTANVTLIYCHEWIELHATILSKDKKKCCLLRDEILKALKHAEEIQQYSDCVSEIAFFCPCKTRNPSLLHLALPITPDNEVMRCRHNDAKYSDLTDRHTLWLEPTEGNLIPYY